ncbi:MAG: hypothetical protein WBF51_01630 [Candidatus Dormiibacterota bacterium]
MRQHLESRLKAATGLELRNGQGNLDNLAGDKLEKFVGAFVASPGSVAP